jgi:DNA-binding MarR family transcriptional regulator
LIVAKGRPDPERLAVWRALLATHARITNQLSAELEAERELPLSWYEVLLVLSESGGRLRMSELADRLVVNRSSLTRQCDRMVDAGLIKREPVVGDARGIQAVLTRLGRETFRRAAPAHLRGVHRHFTQYLTDTDVAALARVFAKLPD